MDLRELQRNWDAFGESDPLFAVASWPGKRGGRWDVEEFLRTGEEEIEEVMRQVSRLAPSLRRRRALDFGCGVGRLTQPLARHFDEATGVDIAPSMIRMAEKLNQHGEKCRYVVNGTDDLRQFADGAFDFIYSSITLQHIAPRYSRRYIAEFIRVLAPDGLLVFQMPSERTPEAEARRRRPHPLARLAARLVPTCIRRAIRRTPPGEQRIEMHGIPRDEVVAHVEANGGRVVDVQPNTNAGPSWIAFRYCVARAES